MANRRFLTLAILAALAASQPACRRAAPAPTAEVVAVTRPALPADPTDRAWDDAPLHVSPLLMQDLVEPRLMTASTAEVRVRAITDGSHVAFRLEWDDDTLNNMPMAGRFSDGCAVQVPVANGPDVPAPQMGETGRAVEIAYWRASWQAVVDGRGDTIKDVFPNATVDHYPFEAASLESGSTAQKEMATRYAPARALGNAMAGPRTDPVQDLVAEGPGTLTPAAKTESTGRGIRTATGWSVVIVRKVPSGVGPTGRGQVAFAVWEGGHDEAGARKMRTGWVVLSMEASR
jgi:DMSO reductase family type II enzyme heme b subunit